MYLYLKALHIIFVVTWFAGLFYMPRLFIYNTEAAEKPQDVQLALRQQFGIMLTRLWYGITWPSAIITLIFGLLVLWQGGWYATLLYGQNWWLWLKLGFVLFLYLYHISLHRIYKQQIAGVFKYTSQQLRIWNEVATVFLIAIIMLVVVKQSMSLVWGLLGLVVFIGVLMLAIYIYKRKRK